MADTHQATYAGLALSRLEVAARIASVFCKRHVGFLHSVRGLHWDKDFHAFTPTIDQELEHINHFHDASSVTQDWTCACFDFRFLQWAFELYLYTGNQYHSPMQHVALSFPHSLYKVVIQDVDVAKQWLFFFGGIGVALDQATMICGPDVLITYYTDSQLLEKFLHYMKIFEINTYSIHTLICSKLLSEKYLDKKRLPDVLLTSHIKDNYQIITFLRHKRSE